MTNRWRDLGFVTAGGAVRQVLLLTYGYSLHYTRLQPLLHTVTASITHGGSLHYMRLQVLLLTRALLADRTDSTRVAILCVNRSLEETPCHQVC